MRRKIAAILTMGMLVTATFSIGGKYTPVQAATKSTFTDVSGHWAESAIHTAAQAGILNGYPDGTFKPGNPITRSELLKVMALTFGLDVNTTSTRAWYLPYKQALLDAKIYMANDYAGDISNPATRNEMAKMSVRGAYSDFRGKTLSAAELMFRAVNAGLLGRTGTKADTVDVTGTTTRAQVAVLIARLLQVKNGATLPVDKGASSAAEIAWHHHNMITMFNQNDLIALPYTKNIDSTYDVIIEQLLVLDPGDPTGYYSEYLKEVETYKLDEQSVSPGSGYLFAYKLKGVSKIADNSKTHNIRKSFYMYNGGPSGIFSVPDKYIFDNTLSDHVGLYQNNLMFKLSKVGATGYDFYYSYMDKDYISTQIKRYGVLPIHLLKYGNINDSSTRFYLTEVKDVWATN